MYCAAVPVRLVAGRGAPRDGYAPSGILNSQPYHESLGFGDPTRRRQQFFSGISSERSFFLSLLSTTEHQQTRTKNQQQRTKNSSNRPTVAIYYSRSTSQHLHQNNYGAA